MTTRQYGLPAVPLPLFINETRTKQEAAPAAIYVNETSTTATQAFVVVMS